MPVRHSSGSDGFRPADDCTIVLSRGVILAM